MTRQRPVWGAHAPRVLFAAPRRKHGRAQRRITIPPSNFRSFGEAPNDAREARALPRRLRHHRREQARDGSQVHKNSRKFFARI